MTFGFHQVRVNCVHIFHFTLQSVHAHNQLIGAILMPTNDTVNINQEGAPFITHFMAVGCNEC